MQNPRLVFILPSLGLDDFPSHLPPQEAENLLAAWTSLWHPEFLRWSGCIPEWKRADSSSLDIQNAILVCPEVSEVRIDQTLRERFPLNESLLVTVRGNRQACLQTLQAAVEGKLESASNLTTQPLLLPDFFALGYAYLQNHLLTKKLRYSSNLDEPLLNEQVVRAAQAAIAQDAAEAEKWLQSCFDQLSQERDHYYSQTAYLLDIVLLAPTTLGERLARQLGTEQPQSLLASASLLQQMQVQSPQNFAKLASEIREKRLAVIGGCDIEGSLQLLSNLALRRRLARGRSSYESLGVTPPQVFSTFTPSVTAELPLHLKQSGFAASILCDWTSASFPQGNQAKITWEAADGSGLDSIANHFLDAANPSSFLNIGSILGSQLDHHQVPTITFAHWPDRTCQAFSDFKLATTRSPALGVWTQVEDYFVSTQRPYHQERIPPQRFPPPISLPTDQQLTLLHRYWSLASQVDSLVSTAILQQQIAGWLGRRTSPSSANEAPAENDSSTASLKLASSKANELQDDLQQVDHWLHELQQPSLDIARSLASEEELQKRIEQHRRRVGHEFFLALATRSSSNSVESKQSSNAVCRFIWNAYSGPRRVNLGSIPGAYQASAENRIYSADLNPDGTSDIIVDVPSMGYVLLPASDSQGADRSRRRSKGIASSDGVLGNEFLESHIDPKSGRLHSLYVALKRGNRLSGQLSVKVPRSQGKGFDYATCLGGKSQLLKSNGTLGKFLVSGDLGFENKKIGSYQLEYTLWRGSRFLEVRIQAELDPNFQQQGSGAAIVWRTAWPNESAVLASWNQGTRQTFINSHAYSPQLIEIDDADHRIYLLCGGHARHNKVEGRFLDTTLDLESTRRFQARLGFGIDLIRPYQSALEWLDPAMVVEVEVDRSKVGPTAWFVQSSAPNVLVQWIDSLTDQNDRLIGARLMLHESSGTTTTTKLEMFRAIKKADRVDITGRSLGSISVDGDSMNLTLRSNEQSFVDVHWS